MLKKILLLSKERKKKKRRRKQIMTGEKMLKIVFLGYNFWVHIKLNLDVFLVEN